MKRILAATAVIGLAVAGMGTSSAAPALQKVTGGGQLATDATSGPGQTLAFNARQFAEGDVDNAQGQFQYNPHRAEDAGSKFHGTVTCLVVDNDVATVAGEYDNGTADGGFFKLTITDTDKGGPQNQSEFLFFEPEADDDCGEPAAGDSTELGRGNIMIHKEKSERP